MFAALTKAIPDLLFAAPAGVEFKFERVRIIDGEGAVLYEGDKAALCRCGGSSNEPFCDGTHKQNGFRG